MYKRPSLFQFACVKNKSFITLKGIIHFHKTYILNAEPLLGPTSESIQSRPIEDLGLIIKYKFKVKILFRDDQQQIIFNHELETDRYGHFLIRISLSEMPSSPKVVTVYDLSSYPRTNLLLGTFFPLEITEENSKFIISDFDKTLVDTRYSTFSEVWQSLKSPIEIFPTVDESIRIIKEFNALNFNTIVLSASPHFYYQSICDWLYKNKIYTSYVFLKDVRSIVSFRDGLLTTKDLKTQGFYKLNQLVQIIHLIGIPNEIIFMGDAFESDPLIYLVIYAVLVDQVDPWAIWNSLKKNNAFRFNDRQNSEFLTLFYQMHIFSMSQSHKPKIQIKIRCNSDQLDQAKNTRYGIPFVDRNVNIVQFYASSKNYLRHDKHAH